MGKREVDLGTEACPIPPDPSRRRRDPWNSGTIIMSVSLSMMIVSNLFMIIVPPTLILPPAVLPPPPPTGSNMLLTKTDGSGNINWSYSYGGLGSDRGFTVIQTIDDGFAVVGSTDSFGMNAYSIWLVRTDRNGYLIWNRTHGSLENQYGYDIVELADGGFAITGSVQTPTQSTDVILIRVDFLGNKLWEKTFGGPLSDVGHSIVRCMDGGLAIGAVTSSYGAGSSDMWLIRTDANGNLLWDRTYGSPERDWANSLIRLRDGGFAFVGYSQSGGQNDASLIRLDSQGNPMWNGSYGDSESQRGWTAAECRDGGFAIVGSEGVGGTEDGWLGRTDSDGDMLWSVTYGGFGSDAGYSVVECENGDFVIAGKDAGNLWLGRTNDEGGLEWSIAFDGIHSGLGFLLTGCRDGGFAFTGRILTRASMSRSLEKLSDSRSAEVENSIFECDVIPCFRFLQRTIVVFRESQPDCAFSQQ
ncbi:MAG: hypothetical protein JSW61_02805 [Candidatus Thorarchaeota archaeon]|nr:MAG: hypothetical protein JSW61_02805 [Candidatus Thorarchaeota archaeon]